MRDKQLDQLIQQMENFQECLKQFNHYVNLTRAKFTPEDENHFLETKSILVQELELILASIQSGTPTREEVHSLISAAPSLREVSGSTARAKPSFAASFSRAFACATGRTAPDNETSPK